MPLFGSRESTPASKPSSSPRYPFSSKPAGPSKPSFGVLESLGLRSMPKKEAAPQPKSPGLFGEGGYKSQWQLREFARRAPYESMPGTYKKMGKQERVGLVTELQERAKKAGQTLGLSEKTYRERLLPQMKKEKYMLHVKGDIKGEKLLEKKMKTYEKWIKGA